MLIPRWKAATKYIGEPQIWLWNVINDIHEFHLVDRYFVSYKKLAFLRVKEVGLTIGSSNFQLL